MTPDLQSSLMCDDVRQERNGKFILIGIFDAIGAARFPMQHPRLFVVTRWCSGQGSFEQRTRIVGPDLVTPIVSSRAVRLQLPSTEAVATHVEVFLNVAFQQPGTHWVEILLNGDIKIRYPLRINALKKSSSAREPEDKHEG